MYLLAIDKVRDVSKEETVRLEDAMRSSIVALAHVLPMTSSSSGGGSTHIDLRKVFRSLGATGQPEVLRIADLQAALVKVSTGAAVAGAADTSSTRTLASSTVAVTNDISPSTLTTTTVTAEVAARLTESGDDRHAAAGDGTIEYRRFEDWVMPPRGFAELRGVLVELVEEASSLGLSVAELFLQLGGGVGIVGDPGFGVDSRQLREGLEDLSVHFTESEMATVLAGRRCGGGGDARGKSNDADRLTLKDFSTLVESTPTRQEGSKSGDASMFASRATDDVDDELLSPFAAHGDRPALERQADEFKGGLFGEACVTPDSLSVPLSPRMSLSELVDARENAVDTVVGEPEIGSSGAAAHVTTFGRVATEGQAVLTTARDGGDGQSGGDTTDVDDERVNRAFATTAEVPRPSPGVDSIAVPTAAISREAARATEDQANAMYALQTSTRLAVSDSGPVSRTRAITPPFGSARSPSEPVHPTRASRERLQAALEGLDLKERLRPTAEGRHRNSGLVTLADHGSNGSEDGSAGFESSDSRPDSRRKEERLVGRSWATTKAGVAVAQHVSAPSHRAAKDSVLGAGRSAAADFSSNSAPAKAGPRLVNPDGKSQRRRHGHDESRPGDKSRGGGRGGIRSAVSQKQEGGQSDRSLKIIGGVATYFGDPTDAPEVIGDLRARVAELELSEQVSSCIQLQSLLAVECGPLNMGQRCRTFVHLHWTAWLP